ncbi:MAG: CRTAC1 family protein [Candidatus Aminicenantes bacterium]|nr:CRTAC1 family protein [Candidatus Aminicenantes bacterium]
MKLTTGIILFFLITNFCSLDKSTPPEEKQPEKKIEIKLVDSTDAAGLTKYTPTFGAAVVDINNDGTDDLVISNHGQIPSLYLNKNGVFENYSHLFPEQILVDRHGVTAVDLDNDGDKDLIFAAGGGDGIGPGHMNRLYQNLLMERGKLTFDNISLEAGISYQPWRSRHFLPLSNSDGSLIDLYLVCKFRANHPNQYLSNTGSTEIKFELDESPGLNQSFNSRGNDLFFDYDRDGDQDLLIILSGEPVIYEKVANYYERNDLILRRMSSVYSAGIADLNNDGCLDIYFGMEAKSTGSDRISFNDNEIHFVVRKQENDSSERITFKTDDRSIYINFTYRIPGKTVRDPSNIFIGRSKKNPTSREAVISVKTAEGEPLRDNPGIYIWKEPGAKRWHIEWIYGEKERQDKGKIKAGSISGLHEENLETLPAAAARDRIFINMKGTIFRELDNLDLAHNSATRSVALCDLNNDGFIDIVGIRGSESGRYNGEPFALINYGNLHFKFKNIMKNSEDDIYQADRLVYGFFNDDGLPDLFFTNGFGLNPGSYGPYKLFLNNTKTTANYVILELEGSSANKDAIGSEVELFTEVGEFLGYRQLGAGFNRSQVSHKLHFGLGQINEKLVARIKWPGTSESEWDERKITINKINLLKQ